MRSRAKIIDATLSLITDGGFSAVTIASAASTAGVSRQTIYSIFGTREEMVSQSMLTVAFEVLGEIHSHLAPIVDPATYITEFIVAARSGVRRHPVLTLLLRSGGDNPLFGGDTIDRGKQVARELLSPLLDMHPDIEPMMDDIVAMSVRLGLSVVVFDDAATDSDDELRRFLLRWLSPALPSRG